MNDNEIQFLIAGFFGITCFWLGFWMKGWIDKMRKEEEQKGK